MYSMCVDTHQPLLNGPKNFFIAFFSHVWTIIMIFLNLFLKPSQRNVVFECWTSAATLRSCRLRTTRPRLASV